MTRAPEVAVRSVSAVLESAVSASTFLAHNNNTLTAPNVRAWAEHFRFQKAWVRAEVRAEAPERVSEALIAAIEPHLEQYINPQTGRVGFAP